MSVALSFFVAVVFLLGTDGGGGAIRTRVADTMIVSHGLVDADGGCFYASSCVTLLEKAETLKRLGSHLVAPEFVACVKDW